MISLTHIGHAFREMREWRRLSTREVATLRGSGTHTDIERFEAGELDVRLSTFLALCDAIDMSPSHITSRARELSLRAAEIAQAATSAPVGDDDVIRS